jgi:hypothetical protein
LYILSVEQTHTPTIASLIDIQRRLADSKNPFLRCIGTLLAAGILDRHLALLSDRQVGQLIIDEVDCNLEMFQPEATICRQATQRLFRSPGGKLSAEDIEKQQQRRRCPKCDGDMTFTVGIDKPDFWQCVSLACGYRMEEPKA